MWRRLALLLFAAITCCSSLSCSTGGVNLQGAGATFPMPVYKRWCLEYYQRHPDVRVNYQSIGSGAGVRQFQAGLVDFGASDAAMSDKEMDNVGVPGGVLLLPMTAGIEVLCYNLPGGPRELKLSRTTYPRIFLGQIEYWDDDEIKADNKGVTIPHMKITPVRRSDGSGTTFAFTNHLAAISEEWKKGPGVGKSVQWAGGIIGGRGNEGCAALIKQTPGAIGYLEFGYAELMIHEQEQDGPISMAVLQNKAGNWIKPSIENGRAALKGVELPTNLRAFIPDPPGADAYPIVTYTWMLCYKKYSNRNPDPQKLEELKKFLRWCVTEGQDYSADLGYIPLPDEVRAKVLKAVDTIE